MRTLLQITGFIALLGWCNIAVGRGPETSVQPAHSAIAGKYNQLDFGKANRLAYDVFAKAYTGYLNLKAAGKLDNEKEVLTVCDYSLSANTNRMWIIDLGTNRVLMNTYVAHGQGSGEEFAKQFSNKEGSHQSSMGFYVTGDTYTGSHGNSLYLHGMDQGYNHSAYERSIVLHGAGYVSKDFIAGTGRLGRSWGCPAVSTENCDKIIDYIKGGTCLYIYYPDTKYLSQSQWLKQGNRQEL